MFLPPPPLYQMQFHAAELQRRTILFDDDVAEYSARVKALEAAAVKMRAQIAEADAGSILKDELLTAALSKQVNQSMNEPIFIITGLTTPVLK